MAHHEIEGMLARWPANQSMWSVLQRRSTPSAPCSETPMASKMAAGDRQVFLEQDPDRMRARQHAQGLAQPGQGIEILRALEAFRARRDLADALQPERAQAGAQVAVANRVPAAPRNARPQGSNARSVSLPSGAR